MVKRKRINRALLYLQRVMDPTEKKDPVSSLRICWYLQDRLRFDEVWDAYHPAPVLPASIGELWFVCSSWAYLEDRFRQRTLEIFPLADRVVWCNNDYNVPFHSYHLGRVRADARLAVLATSEEMADRFSMPWMFDWNRLTYAPLAAPPKVRSPERIERLYYFGSLRANRLRTFDRYFPAWGNRLTVSAANGKDRKKFVERYPTIEVTNRSEDVISELAKYTATPILEDPYSFGRYVGPPNRFYEALSAGTAMFFEPEAVEMWARYGYDVSPFVIPENPIAMLDAAGRVARRQQRWHRDHSAELNKEFVTALSVIGRGQVGVVGPPPGAKRYL